MNPKSVLFYFATITFLVVLSVAEASPQASKVEDPSLIKGGKNGKGSGKDDARRQYSLKTDPENEDFKKYMQAMGYNEDIQKAIMNTKNVIVAFKMLNDTHYYIESTTDQKTCELVFEPGKEFEVELPDGREMKNIITLNKEDRTLHRVIKMDSFDASQDAVFNDNGFSLKMNAKGAEATLDFELLKSTGNGDSLAGRDWRDIIGSWG